MSTLRCARLLGMAAWVSACASTRPEPPSVPSSAASAPSTPASQVIRFHAPELAWVDAPPALPAGAKTVVLEGDPRKAGMFTMRLRLPPGARLAPHVHPIDERVTVLSGSVQIGFGDKFDPSKGTKFSAGAFYVTPTPMHHFVWTDEGCEVQVTAQGPWGLTFVDPADAPRPPSR